MVINKITTLCLITNLLVVHAIQQTLLADPAPAAYNPMNRVDNPMKRVEFPDTPSKKSFVDYYYQKDIPAK